jgi:hypothetical protein
MGLDSPLNMSSSVAVANVRLLICFATLGVSYVFEIVDLDSGYY